MTNESLTSGDRNSPARLRQVIQQFGFERLTEAQEELVTAAIEGKNVLGILPTGGGKSACFQIPGVVERKKTLVISPLIALQENQIQKLRERGIQAWAFHSGLSVAKRLAALVYFKKRVEETEPVFLYVSPEFFTSAEFQRKFGKVQFDTLAIDEAHCVSTWGNAFRPDYHKIDTCRVASGIPQVLAFTATVDPRIEEDMATYLGLGSDVTRVEQSPIRENLLLSVEDPAKDVKNARDRQELKFRRLLGLVGDVSQEHHGPTIVYFNSRSRAAKVYARVAKMKGFLSNTGYTPLLYHAKLPQEDKDAALEAFIDPSIKPIVFATTAFGMGIDKPDVRQVIHYDSPFTLVDYAQQIGRGGRDGKSTLCTTFHNQEDYLEQERSRVSIEMPTINFVQMTLRSIRRKFDSSSDVAVKSFSTIHYMRMVERAVDRSEEMKDKANYIQRVKHSIGLLKLVGVLEDDPFRIKPLEPGSSQETTLIELTGMKERMLFREKRHVQEFFKHPQLSQQTLWEIASRK